MFHPGESAREMQCQKDNVSGAAQNMDRELLQQFRYFLKDSIRKKIDFSRTDQNRGIDVPPIEKPYPSDAPRIDLAKPGEWKTISGIDLIAASANRKSRRVYRKGVLTLEEVSFLLWATRGCGESQQASGSAARSSI